jgi:hypothetical protein
MKKDDENQEDSDEISEDELGEDLDKALDKNSEKKDKSEEIEEEVAQIIFENGNSTDFGFESLPRTKLQDLVLSSNEIPQEDSIQSLESLPETRQEEEETQNDIYQNPSQAYDSSQEDNYSSQTYSPGTNMRDIESQTSDDINRIRTFGADQLVEQHRGNSTSTNLRRNSESQGYQLQQDPNKQTNRDPNNPSREIDEVKKYKP